MNDNPEKYYDQIDAYLRGELSHNERLSFEELLKNDTALKEEFKIHQELFAQADESIWISDFFRPDKKDIATVANYFKTGEAKEFKKVINNAKDNYQEQQKNAKSKIKWLFPVFAAASVIIIILLTQIGNPSYQDLYNTYSDWNDLPSLTSRGDTSELSKGQQLFEQERYEESYALFSKFIDNQSNSSSSVLIYLGLSALELDKYDIAISYFDQLIESDAIDRSRGYWYKVMLYLKQNNVQKAKDILQVIISEKENYNYQKAKDLLSELN